MRVAIHQPNLFPWLGFFDKIARCDVFVYLDHYSVNPRNSTWTKKVKILTRQGEAWLTVPLCGPKDLVVCTLAEMEVADYVDFRKKHLRTIQQAYARCPYFDEVFPAVQQFYESTELRICERNIRFIEDTCQRLGVRGQRIRSSTRTWTSKSTELLVEIVQTFGGDSYLSGDGAEGYQDTSLFGEAGLRFELQRFEPQAYPQFHSQTFVPGLSILDALMNCGYAGVRGLMGW